MPWTKLTDHFEIGFASGAVPDDSVKVLGISGRERISRLYELDVLLEGTAAGRFSDDFLANLLHAPCVLGLGGDKSEAVHGIFQRVEHLDTRDDELPRVLARVVPTVWLLTRTRNSRVFLDKSVKTIVSDILKEYGLIDGTHFSITGGDRVRPYVVQYNESDWDFIQRWLEREGLFYYFQQLPDQRTEKLVIGDGTSAYASIGGDAHIDFRADVNLEDAHKSTVWDWHSRQTRTPRGVVVYDHHPGFLQLLANVQAVHDRGLGLVFHFGEHLSSDEEKDALMVVRAERLACERVTFTGRTDCSRFKAGHTFDFPHRDVDDKKYLIVSIEHRVGAPLYTAGGQGMQRYFGRVEAIPADVVFRPPRVTPWPRIDGVISAHIDTETTGKYAHLDDQGRYWVKMPFDLSTTVGTKASCPIRMAQPYSGQNYGIHHPLHKGAEVLIAHIGGDPDRPVIVGAIPNPATMSPVVDANATQSVTQTASGIRIEMEDNQA